MNQERRAGLDAIFYPASVAVIGVSKNRGSLGAEVFHNLLSNEFQGVAYPVNPKAKFVQAVRAYAKITEIPDPVELAVIVVPKPAVLQAVKECVEKKVKALIIISAGFREIGPQGRKDEDEILALCRGHGIRLVGPNCLGVLNADASARLDATFAPAYPPEGNVAFLSQSGALGHAILDYAKDLSIGISKFISVGNRADVSANDLIEYWADDPKTSVILLYLESFGNPRRFIELARRVGKRKPMVAVKSGRTKSGALAAASHTGALAGSEAAVNALFRETGVIRTDTVEEIFDTAMLLSNQPLPRGRRVAILTNAGGPGIMAADTCESLGLKVPELSPETQAQLRPILSSVAAIRNPVDTTANVTVEAFQKAITILLNDENVDSLLVIHVPPLITNTKDVANAIVAGAANLNKPVITCFMGKRGVPEGLRTLKKGNIPSFIFPEAAVAALARAAAHQEWRKKPTGKVVEFNDFDQGIIKELSAQEGWLPTEDVFRLLEAAKIPIACPQKVATPKEAGQRAEKIGFPVVLKIDSEKILHKTDLGGVGLDLGSTVEVENAGQGMLERAHAQGIMDSDIAGFTLQKMITGGVEVIVGSKRDPKFGHLFMFGLGGVQVEVVRDVAFRLHPFTDLDAEEVIHEVRGFKLLDGFRGRPKCDVRVLQEIMLRMGQLVTLMPNMAEFDLNPVKSLEKGAAVLDARIRLGLDSEERKSSHAAT